MISPFKHSKEKLQQIISDRDNLELTYSISGLAKDLDHPEKFHPNTYKTVVGEGSDTFDQGKIILQNLQHLGWSWIDVLTSEEELDIGVIIITQSRMLGLWGLATSVITEIVDRKNDNYHEYGYVMGSSQYHVLKGEEAFLLRYYIDTEEVEYIIYSYSQPDSLLAKLGRPLLRRKQRQFVTAAVDYMNKKISEKN